MATPAPILRCTLSRWGIAYLSAILLIPCFRILKIVPGVMRVNSTVSMFESWEQHFLPTSFEPFGKLNLLQNVFPEATIEGRASESAERFFLACCMIATAGGLIVALHTATQAVIVLYAPEPGPSRTRRARVIATLCMMELATALSFAVAASGERYGIVFSRGDPRAFRVVHLVDPIRYVMMLAGWPALAAEVLIKHEQSAGVGAGNTSQTPSQPMDEKVVSLPWDLAVCLSSVVVGHFHPLGGLVGIGMWLGWTAVTANWRKVTGREYSVDTNRAITTGAVHQGHAAQAGGHGTTAAGLPPGASPRQHPCTCEAQGDPARCRCGSALMASDSSIARIGGYIQDFGSSIMTLGAIAHLAYVLCPYPTGKAYIVGTQYVIQLFALLIAPALYVQFRCTGLSESAALHARVRAAAFDEANDARRRFLRYIMHEARVPANAIRLGLEKFEMRRSLNQCGLVTALVSATHAVVVLHAPQSEASRHRRVMAIATLCALEVATSISFALSATHYGVVFSLGDPGGLRVATLEEYVRYLMLLPGWPAVSAGVLLHQEESTGTATQSHSQRGNGDLQTQPVPEQTVTLSFELAYTVCAIMLGHCNPAVGLLGFLVWFAVAPYAANWKRSLSTQPVTDDADSGQPEASLAGIVERVSAAHEALSVAGSATRQQDAETQDPHCTCAAQGDPFQCRCGKALLETDAIAAKLGAYIHVAGSGLMTLGGVVHIAFILCPRPTGRAYIRGVHTVIQLFALLVMPALYVQFRCTGLSESAALHARVRAAAFDEANDARRRFLRYIMHEARVPANAIRLGLDSLAMEAESLSLPPDVADTIRDMQDAASAQATIFNSVLSLAAMESGAMKLTVATASVVDMLGGCTRRLSTWAADHGAEVRVSVCPSVPCLWPLDSARVGQVVSNFVSNAIKALHQRRGALVEVTASAVGPDEAGTRWLRVEVCDNGPGIPQAEQAKLFQPYMQIAGSNKTVQGTGLGLTISKHIVEAHGGHIGFSSTEGVGTTFWFELPDRPNFDQEGSTSTVVTAPSAGQLCQRESCGEQPTHEQPTAQATTAED